MNIHVYKILIQWNLKKHIRRTECPHCTFLTEIAESIAYGICLPVNQCAYSIHFLECSLSVVPLCTQICTYMYGTQNMNSLSPFQRMSLDVVIYSLEEAHILVMSMYNT